MSRYPDHPAIAEMRRELEIPEGADFVDAMAPRFVRMKRDDRRAALDRLDKAQTGADGIRAESQLHGTRERLRAVHNQLKDAGC